ncbi:sigma-54-dependent Fis family transcriptional regulator [Roseococcus sp. SYP-B2431]|uniref:sigma-54-dependent transcriptional regulator n=1 Tax=Roseococcus sp. SYP-B2431 TaxID=2496640 RepID=UPI00103FD2F2|nr:sigma-54 dependent transcriptional regulator [Roseococcus sp. SYP-B2431]TCH98675.1 sigma-54-dependent Fis family transcriptional regulator [Roseococcus sp. SYP-B2431]
MKARILLVEDTPTQAEIAMAMLRADGHEIRHAETAGAALALAMEWKPDAILVDLMLPDFSGIELMRRLKAAQVAAAMIMLTAHGSVKTAVEAMQEGASDFVLKPYSAARLRVTLDNALEKRELRQQLDVAQSQLGRGRFHGFVGASPLMQAIYRTIESVAASRATVFVTGESGTGKELAAEALHRVSPRAEKPFVALNCGAIPRDLLESELFGHVKGAFTGATDNRLGAARAADGGTLFLDEIGEMPAEMQVKLLRFVQTGEVTPLGGTRSEKVDVRLVCATHRDILSEVQAGRFREDLYYRIYVVPIELPPLRLRGEDVVLVSRHLLGLYASEEGKAFSDFDAQAEAAIRAYPWPGNVRQLQNVLRNAVVLHDGALVTREMLPVPLLHEAAPATARAAPQRPGTEAPASRIEPLAVAEKRLILQALEHTGQDVPRAAALLEINPSTIYRKLTAWKQAG